MLKLEGENGAKGLSRTEADEENNALKEQIADDKKYIEQVEGELAAKREEWDDRSALRTGELAAISKAISILQSDDARDLFKKSFASQGYSLLQSSQLDTRRHAAAHALAAAAAGDRRFSSLVKKVASRAHFDEVVSAIDNMVEKLQQEEASELATKEECEKDRMEDTRTAAVASRTMDEHTEAINTLKAEIEEIDAEVAEKTEEVKKTEEALTAATRLREDEAAAYAVTKKDDEDAAELVSQATNVLEKFYNENNLMLVQQSPFGEAGKAPPPPPTTWDAPYGGATGESSGIVGALMLIHEDIISDIAKATAEEDKAIEQYNAFKADSEKTVQDLNEAINTLEADKAQKEEDAITNSDDRKLKHGELMAVMKKIQMAQPDCDYFTINYPIRTSNRQTEVDGVTKARDPSDVCSATSCE